MPSLVLALTLLLRTYDMVGVPTAELTTARRAAEHILAAAHIELAWATCDRSTIDPLCADRPHADEILLRIVATAPKGSQALADAYVDSDAAAGALATVYLDRVRQLAAAGDVASGELMGRAIAHEIGHLLLGTTEHSRVGVMRAVWTPALLKADHPGAWRFSNGEATRMRARLEARLEADSALRIAGLVEPRPTPPCPKLALTCGPTR